MPDEQAVLKDLIIRKGFLKTKVNPVKFMLLSFAIVILMGTALLMLPASSAEGKQTSFIDALFTATSATCVTGLVVKDTGTYFSLFGQIVILVLIQIGGLGYMTLTTLLAILLKRLIPINNRIIFQENTGYPTLSQIIRFAQHVLSFVLVFEFSGAFILFLKWRNLGVEKAIKYAIFHAVAAFNNAGFDVLGNFKSFTAYVADPVVNITIAALIISGGLGFIVLSNLYSRAVHKKRLSLHAKIVLTTTAVLIVGGALLIWVFEVNNAATLGGLSTTGKILAAFFQSVTARTAGFNTIQIGKMTTAGLMTLILLMFIGASPGGTGGGIKTVTLIVVLATIASYMRGKKRTEISNRSISQDTVIKAAAIIVLSLLFVYFNTMLLCAFNSFSFSQNIFETVSAFGTVGLSTGITPNLNMLSKLVLTIVMFIGRVGILAPLLLFKFYCSTCRITLPEEEVSVG